MSDDQASAIAARVETFVRDVVASYERDPRRTEHGPTDALVAELRQKAREAGLLTCLYGQGPDQESDQGYTRSRFKGGASCSFRLTVGVTARDSPGHAAQSPLAYTSRRCPPYRCLCRSACRSDHL